MGSGPPGGSLVKTGTGTLTLSGINTYTGATTVNNGMLALSGTGSIASSSGVNVADGAGVFDISATTAGATIRTLSGVANSSVALGGQTLTLSNASSTFNGVISGTGALVLNAGTETLTGANTYAGGTTVSGGTLQGSTTSLQGNIVNNAAVVFDQATTGTYAGVMSGTGSLTKQGSGSATLTGTNTYTGATLVSSGQLVVNGSITSNVTVSAGGTLGGSGAIAGSVVNLGTLAPGNSIGIGTLTVSGSYTQAGGSFYQVRVNAAGQSDRLVVTGTSGTATIQGGTVNVVAAPGTYRRNTTYTILTASGGVTGTYSGATSNFAFLAPSLFYDANNVYLLLGQNQSAFESGGRTANQRAVGRALDQANATATGDFNTVLNALSSLSTQQGPAALEQLSGQAYGGFAVTSSKASQLFMNQLGQQMAAARGASAGGATGTNRVALAEACEAGCEDAVPARLSAWLNAVGALGSVSGDGNTHTTTYSIGGTAAGVDFRVDPQLLVGIGVGYSKASLWLDGFGGNGSSDGLQVALYSGFTAKAIYIDALAGYAYSGNTLQRTIFIPGLQPRTATASPQAHQLFGQLEGGYRIGIDSETAATLTPFARLQSWTSMQGAFSETGADSISLNVAQQNTTSVRSIIGAELAGTTDMGWLKKLALQFRLGWAHEYADVAYPVTASFAGAPLAGFTVLGATLPRDSAIIGLLVQTSIAEAASLYLRYDGEVSSGNNAHALTLGVRVSW